MKFDKKIFEEYLYNRNYSSCIYILDKEIKEILTQKIQNYDNSFKYTTLKELKNKCIEHLDYFDSIYATTFYNLSINPINEQQELQSLFNIYEKLK